MKHDYYFCIPHVRGLEVFPDDFEYTDAFCSDEDAGDFFDRKCREHNVGGERYLGFWCLAFEKEACRSAKYDGNDGL